MNKFNVGKSHYYMMTVLYGLVLLTGCATTTGTKDESCRIEQQTAMVNKNQETISVKVCKRQQGRPWDTP
jgi:hypothetical protein